MHRQAKSIGAICRLTGMSRNRVRKYLREPISRTVRSNHPARPAISRRSQPLSRIMSQSSQLSMAASSSL